MYVCVYVCIYTFVHCLSAYLYIRVHISCMCVNVRAHTCMHVNIHTSPGGRETWLTVGLGIRKDINGATVLFKLARTLYVCVHA